MQICGVDWELDLGRNKQRGGHVEGMLLDGGGQDSNTQKTTQNRGGAAEERGGPV